MTTAGQVTPTEVHRRVEERELGVEWSDGHSGSYSFDYLRGWCPCAACQGHGRGKHFVEGQNSDLDKISLVGNYALQMHWGDGHETGIYSYSYLRQLCPCAECGGKQDS